MSHFLYRLLPPRPDFATDMTDAESAIMAEHFAYWVALLADRKVVAYGPVMDPRGMYGLAVIDLPDEAAALSVARNDPAVRAGAGFSFEVHSMPDAQIRA